jgi:hypothetical protein
MSKIETITRADDGIQFPTGRKPGESVRIINNQPGKIRMYGIATGKRVLKSGESATYTARKRRKRGRVSWHQTK